MVSRALHTCDGLAQSTYGFSCHAFEGCVISRVHGHTAWKRKGWQACITYVEQRSCLAHSSLRVCILTPYVVLLLITT